MSTLFDRGASAEEGFIPLCVPEIRGKEWRYIKKCLDTGWVSSVGSFVDRFEQVLAEYVGSQYAVATVNGTAALHIALLIAGVQADEEVLVSTLTFIAPANAIRYVGAWPVFIDAEPYHWQMDPEKVVDFLEKDCRWSTGRLYNKTTGRRVRAILPVHILGHPVDLAPIIEVAQRYDLVVIEDATESLGAKYRDLMVGHLGDVACFSFNGNKIVTTGGGGMIITDNETWASKARYMTTQAKDDPVEYIHSEVGFNYRLTNVQAAMGCAQLEKLDEYIETKQRIAYAYNKEIKAIPGLSPMKEASYASSTYWMYTVLVDQVKFGLDSRALREKLKQANIEARHLWQPIHRSKAHERSHIPFLCKVAEKLYDEALCLPCSVGMTAEEQKRVTSTLQGTGK